MQTQEATEGDIRLRRGPRRKRRQSRALCWRVVLGASMFWNVEGGRGLFIYTVDEYTHAHIDSGIFFFNFQWYL